MAETKSEDAIMDTQDDSDVLTNEKISDQSSTKEVNDDTTGKQSTENNDAEIILDDSSQPDKIDGENATETGKQKHVAAEEGANTTGAPGDETSKTEQKENATEDTGKKDEDSQGQSPEKDTADAQKKEKQKIEKKDEFQGMRPMAKLLASVGLNLCRQNISKELIRIQNRKKASNKLTEKEEKRLKKLEQSHEELVVKNKPFTLESKYRCPGQKCRFAAPIMVALDAHMDVAHEADGYYTCAMCPSFRSKVSSEFTFHMESIHNRKGITPARNLFFSCQLCNFDTNTAVQLRKHMVKCEKHFQLKYNLEPTAADSNAIPLYPHSQQKSLANSKVIAPKAGGPVMVLPPGCKKPIGLPPGTIPFSNPSNPTQQLFIVNNLVYSLRQVNTTYQLVPVLNSGITPQKIQQLQQAHLATQSVLRPSVSVQQANRAGPQTMPTQSYPPPPALKAATNASKPRFDTDTSKFALKTCEVCGGYVKDKDSLRVHLFWAHKVEIKPEVFDKGQKTIECGECQERFWTYQGKARHKQSAHKKGPMRKVYTCYVCKKEDTHLLQHMSQSHGINLQTMFRCKKCFVCGQEFKEEKTLEQHLLLIHDDLFQASGTAKKKKEQKAKQQAAVAKDTSKPSDPKKANNSSKGAGKGIVPCTICNIWFNTVEEFSDHCNSKHIFRCPRCFQKFANDNARQKHIEEKHKDEKEECPLCREKFAYGREYTEHITQNHMTSCTTLLEQMPADRVDFYRKQLEEETKRLEDLKKQKDAADKSNDDPVVIEDSPLKQPPESVLTGEAESSDKPGVVSEESEPAAANTPASEENGVENGRSEASDADGETEKAADQAVTLPTTNGTVSADDDSQDGESSRKRAPDEAEATPPPDKKRKIVDDDDVVELDNDVTNDVTPNSNGTDRKEDDMDCSAELNGDVIGNVADLQDGQGVPAKCADSCVTEEAKSRAIDDMQSNNMQCQEAS